MTIQMNSSVKPQTSSQRMGTLVGGGLLALFGILVLVDKFVDLGRVMLVYPGVAMFVLGFFKRSSGWMIPAGILNGISLGVILQESIKTAYWTDGGGLFLLGFAVGWFSIPLFSTLFGKDKNLWAIIPGSILTLIGAGFLLGETSVSLLDSLSYVVPVIMIVVGLILVLIKKK
jgi:hypothetical protein